MRPWSLWRPLSRTASSTSSTSSSARWGPWLSGSCRGQMVGLHLSLGQPTRTWGMGKGVRVGDRSNPGVGVWNRALFPPERALAPASLTDGEAKNPNLGIKPVGRGEPRGWLIQQPPALSSSSAKAPPKGLGLTGGAPSGEPYPAEKGLAPPGAVMGQRSPSSLSSGGRPCTPAAQLQLLAQADKPSVSFT